MNDMLCLCAVPEIVCCSWRSGVSVPADRPADSADDYSRWQQATAKAVQAGTERAEELLRWDTPIRTEYRLDAWQSLMLPALWHRCGGSRGLVAIPAHSAGTGLQDVGDQVHLAMWESVQTSFLETTT